MEPTESAIQTHDISPLIEPTASATQRHASPLTRGPPPAMATGSYPYGVTVKAKSSINHHKIFVFMVWDIFGILCMIVCTCMYIIRGPIFCGY